MLTLKALGGWLESHYAHFPLWKESKFLLMQHTVKWSGWQSFVLKLLIVCKGYFRGMEVGGAFKGLSLVRQIIIPYTQTHTLDIPWQQQQDCTFSLSFSFFCLWPLGFPPDYEPME